MTGVAPEIAAYCLDLDADDGGLPAPLALLSAAERDRAGRFRFARDRRRYILRRAWLRLLLAGCLGEAPERLCFSANAFGKPALVPDTIGFNLSHSNGLALYVIGRVRALGCDIERRDPRFAADKIPQQFFAAGEVAALRALPPAARTAGFFNAWTRKEAYIKARGDGLSLPLDSFEVTLDPGAPAALERGCDGWSVRAFTPAPGFTAAVVAPGDGWRLVFPPPPAPRGYVRPASWRPFSSAA